MDLIDRYVNEIGRRLPRRQRADVRAELRSSLADALEERVEGEPTAADVVALLRELGPPEKVAASYRPADQFLIGPDLYPTFKTVAGIVLVALGSALTLAFGLSIVFRPPEGPELGGRLLGLLDGFWHAGVNAFGIVVLIFAGLQRLQVKPEKADREWDPRRLPIVRDVDLVGRGEALFGIVVSATFLALIHLFRDRLGIVVKPGGELLLNHVLIANLAWISAALLLGMALNSYLLWRGRWHWYTRAANFVFDLFAVYVIYRIAAGVALEEETLAAAGLPGPVPSLIVSTAFTVVAVVAFFALFDVAKVIYHATVTPAEAPLRSH